MVSNNSDLISIISRTRKVLLCLHRARQNYHFCFCLCQILKFSRGVFFGKIDLQLTLFVREAKVASFPVSINLRNTNVYNLPVKTNWAGIPHRMTICLEYILRYPSKL